VNVSVSLYQLQQIPWALPALPHGLRSASCVQPHLPPSITLPTAVQCHAQSRSFTRASVPAREDGEEVMVLLRRANVTLRFRHFSPSVHAFVLTDQFQKYCARRQKPLIKLRPASSLWRHCLRKHSCFGTVRYKCARCLNIPFSSSSSSVYITRALPARCVLR
jgi:hypothetical protein